MQFKKSLSVLLSILLVCGVMPVMAFAQGGSCGSNVNWTLSNGTLSITGSGEMVNYSSTTSAPWEEYGNGITSITVADGVTRIGNYAFWGLENVSSVSLGSKLETIGQYAFAYCSALTELVIPAKVKNIISSAFKDSGIQKLTFLGSSLEAIGSNTFTGSGGLKEIKILVPEGFAVGSTTVASGKTGEAPFYNNYVGYTNGRATAFWVNYDGTVLKTASNVAPGTTPAYNGPTPERAADYSYIYTFKRFEPEYVTAAANEIYVYTATYTETPNEDHVYTMTWDDLAALLKAGGEVKLLNDVTAPEGAAALSVPKGKTVTLDLNGYTINRGLDTYQKQGSVIIVSGELTVTDTSAAQTGKITGGFTEGTGGGVWIRYGSFTLAGGSITGNTSKNVGGGVYLSGADSSFTMTGGSITGNTAKNGGGIGMANSGSVTVSGGTISGNTASINGGGIWFGSGTTFTLSGGTITNNTAAEFGGGVYINNGTFDHTGGSVTGNHQSFGEDIAAKSGSYLPTFDITVNCDGGGTVTANKSRAPMAETVTLTVAPNSEDYKLKTLTVMAGDDVIETEKVSEDTYTFSMPAAAVTVSAAFGELYRISTSVDVYNDPYNTYHGCTLSADKDYAMEGETVTLTLDLKPGFEYLSGDVNYTIPITQVNDTTFSFVMPDDTAYADIHLQKAEHVVSLDGTASSDVRFLLNDETRDNAPFTAEYNDDITVIFYPYDQLISGMTYTYTEDGDTVTENISYDWNYTGALEGSFRMPNSDVTVRVEYNEIHSITEDWAQVENGLISADVLKAAEGSVVTVHAAPDQRYVFSGWSFTPDVTLISDTTDASGVRTATFTMPASDVSFFATFVQSIYDVTADLPDGHGTIDAQTRGYGGEPFSFTVTPEAGYAVKSVKAVSGGTELQLTQNGSSYTFDMPYANVTLTAEFEYGSTWADLATVILKGGTVTLQRDYTAAETDEELKVPEDLSVVLDLNGHTINGDALSVDDVFVVNGTLKLIDSSTGGTITGNYGDDVIYVSNGSFEMTGGTISVNDPYYCAVYVNVGCTFLLSGGTVSGFGGDNVISNYGTFDLQGGTITGDSEDIVFNSSAVMLMSGGVIRGSVGTELSYGYGIYLFDSRLSLSGDMDIDVTEKTYEENQGLYNSIEDYDIGLNYSSMLYVTGALNPEGAQLGVTKTGGTFARATSYTITASDAARFKSANPAYAVRLTDNVLKLVDLFSVTVAQGIEHGTVAASASSAAAGDTVTLTLTPEEGYVVESVTVNDTVIEPVNGQYSFEMPENDTTVSAVFALYVDPDQTAADEVIGKINAIGEVEYTEACKAKIDDARAAYNALTDTQKDLVTNYGTLTADETAYAEMKAAAEQAAADQAAANTVIGKIGAIGEVEYTEACKAKIDDARNAYNALTDTQKNLVTNYGTLTAAETAYAEMKAAAEQAAADQAAANTVIGKIGAIGEVEYTEACKAKIDDARNAYNALTDAQKDLVANYGTLTAAETAYAEMKAAAEQATDPTDPSNPTDPTDPSNPTDPTDPSNPTDPTNPDNPTNPTSPTDPDQPDTPHSPTTGGCPLCGQNHDGNNAIKAIHYVMWWLTWLFRDWLPGFFK